MKIEDDFILGNPRISIISNRARPTPIPAGWGKILDSCEILIALPDMHMYVRSSNLDNFKYGAEAILHLLDHVGKRKRQLAKSGLTLRVYQLGDLYELRFPSPGHPGTNASPSEITLSHPSYDRIINTLDSLRTHYVYGNHDFELRHYAGFRFAAVEGKVHLEHGFAADGWSDFANPQKPLWEPGQFVFLKLRAINEFFAKLLVSVGEIQKDEHFAPGVPDGSVEMADYPSVQGYPQKQKEYYEQRLHEQPDGQGIRVTVIGHTHYPYLDASVDGGERMLIDAGAWTSGRTDFAVITNEEAAICRCARKQS